jgi:hypothetical protein
LTDFEGRSFLVAIGVFRLSFGRPAVMKKNDDVIKLVLKVETRNQMKKREERDANNLKENG